MKNLFSLLFLLAWSSYALAKTTLPAVTNAPLPKCTGTLNSFSPYRISKTFNTPQETCKAPDAGLIRVQVPGDTVLKFSYLVTTDYTSIAWRYRRWGTINWTNLAEGESRVNIPEPGSYYEVSAQGICASGMQSEWSAAKGFNTPCTAPRLKDMVITQLGYGQVKIAYRGAPRTGFYWQYKRFNETSWSTELYERDTVVTVIKLQPLTTYQYRLRSRCTTTEWTSYSEPLTFTTIAFPCDTPHVTSFKARFVTDNSAVISCDPVPGALLYVFYYRKKGTQTWSTSYKSRVDQGLISNLENNTVYEYTIQIGCRYEVNGIQLSPLQGTAEFKTLPRICPVVHPDHVSVSYIGERQMQVHCELGATAYAWRYREWQTLNWIDSTQSDSAKWTLKGLKFPASYEIETKIQCPTGEWSDWKGSSKVFSTPQLDCAQPSPDLIALRIVRDSIYTFALFKHFYQEIFWRYRKSGTTEWIILSDSVVYKEGLYVKIRESIEVSIRGTCASLDISDWSEPLKLYGICQEVPLSSIHIKKVGAQSAELECSAELFDGFYWLYRLQGDENWTRIKTEGRILVLEGLLSQSTYEVQVQRICTEETGSGYSKTLSFVTSERSCDPINVQNLYAFKITARSAAISCDFSAWAKHYILAYRTLGEQNWISTAPQADQEWQLDSLLPNTVYEYRIGIRCDLTEDPVWSIVRTFTTLAPQCGGISEKNIEVRSPKVFWATFKCFEYGYRQYQWRYRSKEDNAEWVYVDKTSPTILSLYDPLYELQVRGICDSNNKWSEWSESKLFVPRQCGFPDSIEFVPSPRSSTTVEIEAQGNEVPWYINQFKWYYRILGQKDWLDSVHTRENTLLLHNLLPDTRYEVLLEMACNESLPNKMTAMGEFTSPAECFVPTAQTIRVQKVTQQSAEIALDLAYTVEYEVRYRVKGSLGAYRSLFGTTGIPALLTQLSSQTEYEVMLRIICKQGAPWTEAFYIRTKACDIPYAGRIVLSEIAEDSVKAYVELHDFNPVITGVSYTWRFKPAVDSPWQQVFVNASNTLAIKNLRADEFYDLQAVLKCKNNVQDSIAFITHFKATTNECSNTPDLAWINQIFYGDEYGFGIKCNLPFGYSFITRHWSTDRQNVIIDSVRYTQPTACTYADVGFNFEAWILVKFQFRLVCPDGNIGPWSEVITLDKLKRAREMDPGLLLPRRSTPAAALTIKLWPNPTSGTVQVQLPSIVQGEMLLSVFSVNGRKVMTQKVQVYDQMPVEFDLSGQTPGLYFVRVQNGKNTFTERILLQKH